MTCFAILVRSTVVLVACCALAAMAGCLAPAGWSGSLSIEEQAEHVEQTRREGHRRIREGKRLSSRYRERSHDVWEAYESSLVRRVRSDAKRDARRERARAAGQTRDRPVTQGRDIRRVRTSEEAEGGRFRRTHIHTTPRRKQNAPRRISGGEPVSAHFVEAPLHAVIDSLALVGGSNIVAAQEIADEKVTFRVRHAGWRDALAIVARTHGWVAQGDGEFIYVRPRGDAGDGPAVAEPAGQTQRVELLSLAYVAAEEVKKAVAALFADTESKPLMSADPRTGSLVVKGSVEQINMVASLAKSLDKPVPQILIETFIVEAGKGLETSLGARLGIDRLDSAGVVRIGGIAGEDGRSDTEEDTERGNAAEKWVVNLPVAASAGGLAALFDSDRLRVELTALEQEGKTRIVSNPRVFTLDGQEAVIFQGDEVPYFSVSDSGTQTEFKEAGVRLAVTPKLIGKDNMMLKVTVNKDTVDTRVQNPPITRRQIDTTLLVADGELVVIGGIYFDTLVRAETRVPFFNRIPLLGRLFKRSRDTRDLRELLVFIAPKVIGLPP